MSLESTSMLATGSFRIGRVLLRVALRGVRTALVRGATTAAIFVVAAFAVDRLLVGADTLVGIPLGVLYVLYVGAGALLGGYAGMAAAVERQAAATVRELADVAEPLLLRAVHDLPLGEGALDPARLRALATSELGARGRRSLVGPAMFEYAALGALRDRVLAFADELEANPDADARAALADVVGDTMTTGVASELEAQWRRSRLVATAAAAAALVSLPLLALAAG